MCVYPDLCSISIKVHKVLSDAFLVEQRGKWIKIPFGKVYNIFFDISCYEGREGIFYVPLEFAQKKKLIYT